MMIIFFVMYLNLKCFYDSSIIFYFIFYMDEIYFLK